MKTDGNFNTSYHNWTLANSDQLLCLCWSKLFQPGLVLNSLCRLFYTKYFRSWLPVTLWRRLPVCGQVVETSITNKFQSLWLSDSTKANMFYLLLGHRTYSFKVIAHSIFPSFFHWPLWDEYLTRKTKREQLYNTCPLWYSWGGTLLQNRAYLFICKLVVGYSGVKSKFKVIIWDVTASQCKLHCS